MDQALRLAHRIDRWVDRMGRAIGWLALAMVLIGSYNAIVRYLGKFMGWTLSSNAYIELQWYLFSLVFLFGAAYAMRQDRHVRVDVFYGRLSARQKAWIDLLGTLLLMMPFTVYMLWVTIPSVHNSWVVREVSPDPGGLARYPIKAALLAAFGILFVQGISQVIKEIARLRGIDPEPGDPAGERTGGFHGEGI